MLEPLVIIPPIKEPVSLTEAKEQCRVEISETAHNTVLGIFIAAARNYVEWRAGITIHETTLEIIQGSWPSGDFIVLPRATPLIAIDSVWCKDEDAIELQWNPIKYIADVDSAIGRLVLEYGESWPSFTAYPVSPIRIRYRAGLATGSPDNEASDAAKYPVLLLVAGMFDNRESENISDRGALSKISADYGVEAFINRLIPSDANAYVF